MPCPSCNSSNVDYDDDVLVCQSCGTVLEDVSFQDNDFTSAPRNIEYYVKTKKTRIGKHTRAKEYVDKIAAYFHIPEDLATKAKQLIQQHSAKLPNRYNMELGLIVVYLVARDWLSTCSIDDFIENFPVPVDRSKIQRIQFIFAQESVIYKDIQCKSSRQELQMFLNIIIPHLRKQFDETPKITKSTLIQLKHRTEALFGLGDEYLLNTGRKLRPTIIVAAIISYASILVSNPKFKSSGKTSIFQGRRLDVFRKCCIFGPRLLRMRLQEYTDLLLACAQNIPWIKDPEAKHAHYYLKDILDLYTKKDGEQEPSFRLTDNQYSLNIVKKSAELTREYEAMFQFAQQHLDNGTKPENLTSLNYCVYNLMKMGYEKEHLILWTEKNIRGMSDSLNFRAKYGTALNSELDLNRKEVDDKDMLDTEIDLYTK